MKCHRCGEPGHFEKHCPKGQSVKSDSKSKPPGAKSFNIEVAVANEERLDLLESTTKGAAAVSAHYIEIENAACGVNGLEDSEDGEKPGITFVEGTRKLFDPEEIPDAEGKLGSPLCATVKRMLEVMRPYPSDPGNEAREFDRFMVYETSDGKELVVMDSVTDEEELLDAQRAAESDFLIRRCDEKLEGERDEPSNEDLEEIIDYYSPDSSEFDDCKSEQSNEQNSCKDNVNSEIQSEVDSWEDFYGSEAPADNPTETYELGDMGYDSLNDFYESETSEWLDNETFEISAQEFKLEEDLYSADESNCSKADFVELNAQQLAEDILPAAQQNAAMVKDPSRVVPNPITVVVHVNGKPARALIDSGSLCDFMSSTLADQLKLHKEELKTPLIVQLAVLGSRSKVNNKVTTDFAYQGIQEKRAFDIINLSSYDMILGTPFLYQHSVMIGFNQMRIVIGILPSSEKKTSTRLGNIFENALLHYAKLLKKQSCHLYEPLTIISSS
ncbi:unnamed protein product [Cyclocybe aegerita]|uniref:CCHC-type domain-containing protein n=1 Tax=Cyclocybe aegerita TaxID=1973307 RepID=A0A8S0WZJ2_CYCAE|nr:unnamed protein product [Cyclocybe aegerita]